ncbi:ATP-grasp domain-containing protein [Methanobrevibacter sp.]|uniref:ATP-grasp domain-containing protein n=1 Tax=Methanobrevibacter sp. TaxID=66852 RepID=UPI0025F946DB|nr:ATP-grasp domain-containing protein [Methanobrevibacter sp.]MBQ2666759.1 ATP-grasp domain-containing protein [Methanobrevibacter sp.]
MNMQNKKNIIIVECKSTGTNFIADIINRGYNPVMLDTKYADSDIGKDYEETLRNEHSEVEYDFDLITEKDTYEETLEMVKEWDPILVLPGNEKGVILASKLAYDLNLKCNDIENLDSMTLKDEMQNRLAEKGLRSIRGKVIKTIEEAIEFYDGEDLDQVVLKPTYSCGGASVRICTDKEEMIMYLNELLSKTNRYGDELNEVLVQERILGDEYIVNTVTCEGHHRVTLVWKYNKIRTTDGAIVYDTCETVNELNLGEAEMVEYAYNVADALGIEYGPVHGEYMIDEKGPVLIEVNCRPCGGHMPAKFLDQISGQHETDSILDAYLKPDRFKEKLKNRYRLHGHGALKFFIVPKDMVAISSPMENISIKLESHVQTSMDDFDETDKKTYFKTEDLDSSCGIVYLAHKDYGVIQDDINYLRNVEKHAFSLVLSEEKPIETEDENIDLDKVKRLIDIGDVYGTGLFITDETIPDIDVLQISPDKLGNIRSEFDYIIVNLNESMIKNSTGDLVNILLDSFDKIKAGGLILIPKSTYKLFTNERRGVEALIKLLNLKIELPPYGMENIIIASKK